MKQYRRISSRGGRIYGGIDKQRKIGISDRRYPVIMGVLDGIAKVKDMLQENNSCNGKIARLIEQYHSNTQAEMVGIKTEPVEEFEQMEFGDTDD